MFRQRHANPELLHGCAGCDKANICGGGCAARSYLFHAVQTGEKSFLCKDPYCPKDYKHNFISEQNNVKTKRLVHMDYLCTWIGKVK